MAAITILPGGGVGFWLTPADIEPVDDPAWWLVTPAFRARFWAEAIRQAAEVWDASRAKGLDRFGRKLARLAAYTIEHRRSAMGSADPGAPPLIPAHDLSRTRSYLRHRYVEGQGGYFWWRHDPRTKGSWGRILQYHAQGLVNGGKVRDVIGFSPKEVAVVRRHMAAWFRARRPQVPGMAERQYATTEPRSLRVTLPPIGAPLPKVTWDEPLWQRRNVVTTSRRGHWDRMTETPKRGERILWRSGPQQFKPTAPEPPRPKPVAVKPPPKPKPVRVPAGFRDSEAAATWAAANLRTPIQHVNRGADLTVRETFAAIARIEHELGGKPLPVDYLEFGRLDGPLAATILNTETGVQRITIRGDGTQPAEYFRAGNETWQKEHGVPWIANEPSWWGVLWHEIGHAYDNRTRTPNGDPGGWSHALRRAYFEAPDCPLEQVSGYAATDWWAFRAAVEGWAECFAAIVTRSPAAARVPEPVRKLVEALLRGEAPPPR